MENSLAAYLRRQQVWSLKTFGDGLRTVGLTQHILKECEEIRQAHLDLEEWADVIILALDGYWRAGGTSNAIMEILQAKQDKNFAREWTPTDGNSPSEHKR